MAYKSLIESLSEQAETESRDAVEKLIDMVMNHAEDIQLRRLAWQKLEIIYYATSESFAEWADSRVMQRGAKRP